MAKVHASAVEQCDGDTLYSSALVPGASPVLLSEGAASSAATASSLASTAAILASKAVLATWK